MFETSLITIIVFYNTLTYCTCTATDRFKKVDVPGFKAGMQNRGAMAASGAGSNNGDHSEGAKANACEMEKIGNARDGVVEIVAAKIHEGITQAAKKDLFA